MNRLIARIHTRFVKTERSAEAGQGLAEYALILALIAAVCIGALGAMGVGIASSAGFVALPASL
jgi:Flp pilus assembly pilin Flp